MKKVLILFGAVMLVLSLMGTAGALSISFTDTVKFTDNGLDPTVDDVAPVGVVNSYDGVSVTLLEGFGDHIDWTHKFDFDYEVDEIVSGELTLSLVDEDRDKWCSVGLEFALGITEDGTWAWGEVDTQDYFFDVTTSYLMDGSFSVYLASLGGDFYIDESALTVTYNAHPAAPVPEPTSMMLSGVGLIGMAVWGRKRLINYFTTVQFLKNRNNSI